MRIGVHKSPMRDLKLLLDRTQVLLPLVSAFLVTSQASYMLAIAIH